MSWLTNRKDVKALVRRILHGVILVGGLTAAEESALDQSLAAILAEAVLKLFGS